MIACIAATGGETAESGMEALKRQDFALAQRIFSALVTRQPSADNFYYLAIAEARTGDTRSAIVHFSKSIQKGNRTASVHYNLALTWLSEHNSDAGIAELKSAIAADPAYLPACYALGVALVDAGRPVEAIPYLDRSVQSHGSTADVWANLVRAYLAAGELKSADAAIDKASTKFPEDIRVAVTLADLCIRFGRIQKARYLLENASGIAPDDGNVKLLLARASLLAGEPLEALAVLKDIPPGTGQPGETLLLLGEAQALTKRFDAAEIALSAAIAANPRDPAYLVARAWLYQLLGRYNDAMIDLGKARALNSDSPYIAWRMAVNSFLTHQPDEAARMCDALVRRSPSFDRAYFLLGTIRIDEHRFSEAQAALERATQLRPQMALYRRQLGIAQLNTGDAAGSSVQLSQALDLDPRDAESYFWRGKAFAAATRTDRAISDLEAAVALQPKLREAYTELSKLYAARGDTAKALSLAAKAAQADPAPTADDVGDYLRDLGDLHPETVLGRF